MMIKFDSANPQQSAGVPINMQMPGQAVGTKLWAQARNATNGATVGFYFGVHEYVT